MVITLKNGTTIKMDAFRKTETNALGKGKSIYRGCLEEDWMTFIDKYIS